MTKNNIKVNGINVEHQHQFKKELSNRSDVEVNISVKIENFSKEDFNEVLSNFAECSRNFYLQLAEKINNTP